MIMCMNTVMITIKQHYVIHAVTTYVIHACQHAVGLIH